MFPRSSVRGPKRGPVRALAVVLAVMAALIHTPEARAAACCTSATAFGVGRLLLWEDFAAGLMVGHHRILAQYDSQGALRWNPRGYREGITEVLPWVILRAHPRIELQVWTPLLANDRSSTSEQQLGAGLGDVGAAARFQLLGMGEFTHVPAVALTMGVTLPTGRRIEETRPPLFAGTTGRGALSGSMGLEVEYASLPWFVRGEAGVLFAAPFERTDTGQHQLYGPTVRVGVLAGRGFLDDALVVACALRAEWEERVRLNGRWVDGSSSHATTASTSISYRVDPHWTLQAAVTSSVWLSSASANRDGRIGATVGVRYGHF